MADLPEDTTGKVGATDPLEPTGEAQAGLRERRVEINEEFESIDQFLAEYISNVSHTGAFIRTRDPWPVGTQLRVKFTILAEDPEILEGAAKVVRVDTDPSGMGVEFVELTDESRTLIDKLLAKNSRASRTRTRPDGNPTT